MANGSRNQGGPPGPQPQPAPPELGQIAQATQATADAVTRLLAVARFGPTAGAGSPGSAGITGPRGGSPSDADNRSAYHRLRAVGEPVTQYRPDVDYTRRMGTPAGTAAANIRDRLSAPTFSDRQNLIAERSAILSRLGLGGAARVMGQASSFAGGLQGAGATGAAALVQRAAVPLAVAGLVANTAEKVAGYAYDRYSTDAQIGRQAVRDLVPGGERAQRFIDALSGRAAGMEQADIQGRIGTAGVQARLSASQFALGANPQQAGREGLAAAYRGQSAVAPSVFDRATALGERAYREEQRLLPLKLAEARAEREAAAASRERLATQSELSRLTARGVELTRQRRALEGKLTEDGYGSGASRQEVLRRIENVNQEVGGNLAQQRAAREALVGAEGRDAQARGERDKARRRTELLGRAETLEDRADTAAGAARRLGGMSEYDRAFGLRAARLVQQRGSADGLPEELLSAALAFAPNTVGKIVERTGAGSAAFRAASADPAFAADYGGDPTDLRRQAAEARRQLAGEEFDIDARVAGQSAAAGRDLGQFVGNVIRQEFETAKREILNAVRLGRNAN